MPASPDFLLISLLATVLLIVVAVAFLRREEARQSAGMIFISIFTIIVPVVAIFSIPLWVLSQFVTLSPQVWQALVAGVGIATGWITTASFAELGRQRDRREKTRDYHRAIFAEIGNNLENIDTTRADGLYVANRMQDEPNFVPFIPQEENDALFRIIAKEIQIFPRKTIDPIVAYYSQIRNISSLALDMRSEEFHAMPVARRVAMYEDYIQMRVQAQLFGDLALREIDAYENGSIRADREASREASRALSIRGGVPSDRSQE